MLDVPPGEVTAASWGDVRVHVHSGVIHNRENVEAPQVSAMDKRINKPWPVHITCGRGPAQSPTRGSNSRTVTS